MKVPVAQIIETNDISGTGGGRVIKVINAKSANSTSETETVVIEELQVFGHKTIIKGLQVTFDF